MKKSHFLNWFSVLQIHFQNFNQNLLICAIRWLPNLGFSTEKIKKNRKTFNSWRCCNRFSFFRRQKNLKVSLRFTPKSSLTCVPVTKSPYGARSRTCDTQPVNRRSTPKICQPRVSFSFSRMNAGHQFWEVCIVL